jgi:peptidyl-prolyl cis-trans isomerase SurA
LKLRIWLALALGLTVAAAQAATPPGPAGTTAKPPATKPATAKAKAPSGGTQRLDGITAVVNDEVVLESDVEEQLYLFLMRAQTQPDSSQVDTLRQQILDQLIDEKLIVAEAKRQGVTVTDAEVNKQVDEAIQDAKTRLGSAAAFAEQLQKENMTEDKLREKYRNEVRRQLVAQRLVQRQIIKKPVSATEAEAYFKAHPDKFPKVPPEVRVAVVQIPVTADSVTEEKARARALAARKRIVTGGEKFAKVAAEVSEDPGSAQSGGDLGYFTRGRMDPVFEDAAFRQKIGEVGMPVHSAFGWHIIEVIDRDTVKTAAGRDSVDDDKQPVIEAHARHILIRVDVADDDVDRAKRLAEKVHGEAIKGTDFGGLVKKYSHYQGPQSDGGDLGFLSYGQLQPQIRAGLDTVKVGGVSDVLVNRAGFNIFKVLDRKPERDYQLDEIKDDLPQAVAQIQYREKYDAWVKSLRNKAHIEIRKS